MSSATLPENAVQAPKSENQVPEFFRAKMSKPKPVAPFVPVKPGEIVRHFSPGSQEASIAIVQEINGDGTLLLTGLPYPGRDGDSALLNQNLMAVMHRNQPRLTKVENDRLARYGTWDLTEDEIERRAQLKQLLEDVETLKHQVRGLKSRKGGVSVGNASPVIGEDKIPKEPGIVSQQLT